MKYHIEENTLTPDEFIELSKQVGWGVNRNYDMAKVVQAIADTSFTVKAVLASGEIMGCARAFSDDLLMTFIPDIFVSPRFQGMKVGSALVGKIKERYGHTSFFLGAQKGNESFFEKLGFEKSLQSYSGRFKKSPYWK